MPIDLQTPLAPEPIPEEEIWDGTPNVVLDGERYAIGWQRFPAEEGGAAYVTARRGLLGGWRVLGRYPRTAAGWAMAWAEFARLDPGVAEKTRVALGRFYAARPPAGILAFIPALVLTGIDPPAGGFAVGKAYDLRFGEDGLQIARSGSPDAAAEYGYADVAAVLVTGFKRVLIASKWQLFMRGGPFYGLRPAWPDWMYEYRFRLRVRTVDRVLDFWHRAGSYAAASGEDFGRWLEPVNRAMREALLSAAADNAERSEWLVSELSRLAERLDHGTLTRSDFDLLRARISGGF